MNMNMNMNMKIKMITIMNYHQDLIEFFICNRTNYKTENDTLKTH